MAEKQEASAETTTEDPGKCVHCGNPKPVDELREDWPCEKCMRFQSSAVCPTCGSVVSASVLKKK